MKKKILIGVFLLMIGVSNTFASGKGEVNDRIISSFQKEFAGAQNVEWSTGKDFVRATFTLNEQVIYAYYSQEGNLLGVTRNIIAAQLPINLFTDLKKKYSQYWITDLFEMAANNETSYYVTLESADYKLVLKSNSTNGWQVYKKEKKGVAQ